MIETGQGNLLETDAEALVNTVNCVGVMGKGIALQFKQAFPENYEAYHKACKRDEVVPGRLFVQSCRELGRLRWIVNFPTKRHWRGRSRLEDIRVGLEALAREIAVRGIRSIALPPLGCGHGGLDWNDVRPLIEETLGNLPDVRVVVFEPGSGPAAGARPIRTRRTR